MRGRASLLDRRLALGATASGHRPSTSEHPLLRLQRSAGNQAVTAYVQRESPWAIAKRERNATSFFSQVALTNEPRSLYKGKTDATFAGVNVERHWEWGLAMDDIAIVFQCGRQRFRFEAAAQSGGLWPWTILDRHGRSDAWTNTPVKDALTTIYHHWKDEKRFQAATQVVIERLKSDVEKYRQLEADFQRQRTFR